MEIEFHRLNGEHEVRKPCHFCAGLLKEGDFVLLLDQGSEPMHRHCLLGRILSRDDMITLWHEADPSTEMALHEWLGMTPIQYKAWIEKGTEPYVKPI